MKKYFTYLIAALALLSLIGCGNQKQNKSTASSSKPSLEKKNDKSQKSSSKASSEKSASQPAATTPSSSAPLSESIGTLTAEDEAAIRALIENGHSMYFSRLVKPETVLGFGNDYGEILSYRQDELLDYYNTYSPETYQLEDVIQKQEAQVTSDSIKAMSEAERIELSKSKTSGWLYSSKDQAFYEFVAGGRGGAAPPIIIPPVSEWVINDDSVIVKATMAGNVGSSYRYVLKRNNKDYSGGAQQTRFYAVSRETID